MSVGWGGDQWNVNAWGDLATTYAPVTTADFYKHLLEKKSTQEPQLVGVDLLGTQVDGVFLEMYLHTLS